MAECMRGLELPPGYHMWTSETTLRIRHYSKRTGAELEGFIQWLERVLPDGMRIECADGWVVVSGMPSDPHEIAIEELDEMVLPVAQARGWRRGRRTQIWRAAVRDFVEPDYALFPKGAPPVEGQSRFHGCDVIMVAEVTSKDSLDDDRVSKRIFYARTGVPLYLLVDLHAAEVVLSADPVMDAYRTSVRVEMGEQLKLPSPVDLVLDTSRLTV